jgi:hypothetical protein
MATQATQATSTPTKFFDSWGALWEICSPDAPEAVAFGPQGCARRCAGPTWAEASLEGWILPLEEWDFLVQED